MADNAYPDRAQLRPQGDLRLPQGAEAALLAGELQRVAWALARNTGRDAVGAQGFKLMQLTRDMGAMRLHLLAEILHERAGDPDCADWDAPLAELRNLLHGLILALQAAGNAGLMRS